MSAPVPTHSHMTKRICAEKSIFSLAVLLLSMILLLNGRAEFQIVAITGVLSSLFLFVGQSASNRPLFQGGLLLLWVAYISFFGIVLTSFWYISFGLFLFFSLLACAGIFVLKWTIAIMLNI